MARTPEQKAADDRLEDAVKAAMDAYDLTNGALVDVLVLTAQTRFDDEGEQYTTVGRLTLGGMPHYRILGLLDFAQAAYRSDIATSPSDVEDE
jgi:hypothetical protein